MGESNATKFVLVTPAHNESLFIERVIRSVLSQTVVPEVWVIVDDHSSDRTGEIVSRYALGTKWIVSLNAPTAFRAFPSKVYGFNAGYEYIKTLGVPYDIIGNLDADISFSTDYFKYLLDKFDENPLLGVAGTGYAESEFNSTRNTKTSKYHVNGQCQFFRKKCFEEIGGYTPINFFGEDLFAVIMARYKGWKTESFSERVFMHHRPMGTRCGGPLIAKFVHGRHDYILGNRFLWQLLRAAYWTQNRPYLLGGTMLMLGYVWSFIRGDSIVLSGQALKMYRDEQYQRLISICKPR